MRTEKRRRRPMRCAGRTLRALPQVFVAEGDWFLCSDHALC